MEHDLYTNADENKPDCILDWNGEVVLGLCKRCRKGECELTETCEPAAPKPGEPKEVG